ncbi:phosphotransferase enzyme family protein [Ferruginibacter sp. SUN106]|uniref:phosphotransferase enzyme family protein n=1 Tax=Ferruginibacter sp. SUN106 TaxID=2978348 RepID=UPI003D359E65
MIATVLKEYGFESDACMVQSFGSGLINSTWKIINGDKAYILQRINHKIFKQPEHIAENISMVAEFLQQYYPDYLFVAPLKTVTAQETLFCFDDDYFRMFPFVQQSHTIDVVTKPGQAYEAAVQFGAFTKKLAGFNAANLKITLPDFHNLTLRYRQFENVLVNGNAQRIKDAAGAIATIKSYKTIVDDFEKIKLDNDFKIRATHHDTKISNVLFDEQDKGLCVIDLDTIMPGYFISDVGDMLRTYLSPANEEEKDFSKIDIRDDYFTAVKKGYLLEMNDELTAKEKQSFVYAGKFMIYMQALRFLTDYFNDDAYYGEKYAGHNLIRAKNQLVLLEKLSAKERSGNI